MANQFDRRALLVGLSAAGLSPSIAHAEDYPKNPIRLIVAFAAGGPTDVLARLLADGLGRRLGQSVIVDNRGGAGGNIGYGLAAGAMPDGYTLAFADPSITVNASLYKSLPFDVERDLPLNFHPLAIRASADFAPIGAVKATCGRRSWSGLRSRSHVAERLAA